MKPKPYPEDDEVLNIIKSSLNTEVITMRS
jgi:hypothetical protein